MSRQLVIGLDFGTTSVKACVFDLEGHLITEYEEMNSSSYPKAGWVEQDPKKIESAAVAAIKIAVQQADIQKGELISLGFSSAMHSLICVDQKGKPLSPALIWSDGRSVNQAESILSTNGNEIYSKTGMPIHPMSPFLKLLWMKETGYEPYLNAKYFMSIKEYILYCWFNQRVIDYSMASATGLYNPSKMDWDKDLLEQTGVVKEQLSDIVPPTYILKNIKDDVAKEMGITTDVPFAIGSADGQLSNLGIGAILPGEVAISVGTSGAVRQITKGFKVGQNCETFCYAFTEDDFIIGGPTNNGGIAVQWLKDVMNHQGSFDSFLAEAEDVAPGAEGMIFLPYINGERAPLWNQQAKGTFYGMTLTHKSAHFIRAVLEGITFNIYQIGKALERLAGEPKKIYVNGGLSRSSTWLQIMADVFGKEINVSETHHSAAWGAAWVSLVAVGEVDSFEAIKKNTPMGEVITPKKEHQQTYSKIYKTYENLSKDLLKYF